MSNKETTTIPRNKRGGGASKMFRCVKGGFCLALLFGVISLSFLSSSPALLNVNTAYMNVYDVVTAVVQESVTDWIPSSTTIRTLTTRDTSDVPSTKDAKKEVEIVYLLSFPGSGASYALSNVEYRTNTSTATVYASELVEQDMPLVPVFTKGAGGPYWRSPRLAKPRVVLTKTHCSGYCDVECEDNPMDSMVSSLDTFATSCNNQQSSIKAVVYLIRNPFDTIVSRLRRGIWKLINYKGWTDDPLTIFTDGRKGFVTRQGFDVWCKLLDEPFERAFFADNTSNNNTATVPLFTNEIQELARRVPCFSEWIRYVRWHNFALQAFAPRMMMQSPATSSSLVPQQHSLYYEEFGYSTSAQHAMQQLDDVLLAPTTPAVADNRKKRSLPFTAGLTYEHLYQPHEARDASRLVRALATPACWTLLRSYMSDWLQKEEEPKPATLSKVVWLMSFPNSGTSYTMENTLGISNASTATNYGLEALRFAGRMTPLQPEKTHGPFWLDPNAPKPPFVLTKTHCVGFCDGCKPLDTFQSVDTMLSGCREVTTGAWPNLYKTVDNTYTPSKAVHLFRSPFDNLVARMHLGARRRTSLGLMGNNGTAAFVDSRQGLLSWCSYIDNNFEASGYTESWLTFTDEAKALFSSFPCYSDLFRWVQWHNLALEVCEKLDIPVHYLYYEDYTTRFNDSVRELNQFLQLPQVNDPAAFHSGKTYLFFSPEEFRAAARLVHLLASPKCWELVRRYFAGESFTGAFEINPKERFVVWFMAFPGSGVSFLMDQHQTLTKTTTATNIGEETTESVPYRLRVEEGPFLLKPYLPCPRFVLTKTHCDGYCDDCNQSMSRTTPNQFEAGCRTTTRMNNGARVLSQYNVTVPKKAVHLVRNPFDNIVARMHQGILKRRRQGWSEDQLSIFNDTKAGLLAWCHHVDTLFSIKSDTESLFLGEAKEMYSNVPCYSEWDRFVQWHNHAAAMTRRLPLPSRVLYYEDYFATTHREEIVSGLVEFLEMPADARRQPEKVTEGLPSHSDLFEPNHRRMVARFIHSLATPLCWERLRRYLETLLEDATGTALG